jgi:FkbM family methyltransferase
MLIKNYLHSVQRVLAHSTFVLKAAIKVRNQCNAVISSALGESINADENGESLLIETMAPMSHCFVDVGANVGTWSHAFARSMPTSGKGFSFEPSLHTSEILRKNLKECPNIEVIQIALSDVVGTASFYNDPKSSQLSRINLEPSDNIEQHHTVSVSTIDVELSKRDISYVDFLKIDTEGHDLLVLKGANHYLHSQKIGLIQFEYNRPWKQTSSTLTAATNLLRGFGYKVYLLRSTGLHPVDDRLDEYFTYSNYVACSPAVLPILKESLRPAFP